MLIDIVSKNSILLLKGPLRLNGKYVEAEITIAKVIGSWLRMRAYTLHDHEKSIAKNDALG